MLFECEDLAVASPATVSRCGMVYTDYADVGWRPFVNSWLDRRKDKASEEHLNRMFDKYVEQVLEFRRLHCTELLATSELNSVESLCTLLNALLKSENGVSAAGFLFNLSH